MKKSRLSGHPGNAPIRFEFVPGTPSAIACESKTSLQQKYKTRCLPYSTPISLSPSSPMAPLAAISSSRPDTSAQILDAIEVQFKLDDVALTRITTQFLQEIANGLAEYGQAMAIMYVQEYHHLPLQSVHPALCDLVQRSSPASHRARRRGQSSTFPQNPDPLILTIAVNLQHFPSS